MSNSVTGQVNQDPKTGRFVAGNTAARHAPNDKGTRQLNGSRGAPPPVQRETHTSTFNRLTSLAEREEFLQECWAEAQNGNAEMRAYFMRLMLPLPKAVSPAVQFDLDLSSPGNAAISALAAAGAGVISTDQARDIVSALTSAAELAQLEQMQQEIARLTEVLEHK